MMVIKAIKEMVRHEVDRELIAVLTMIAGYKQQFCYNDNCYNVDRKGYEGLGIDVEKMVNEFLHGGGRVCQEPTLPYIAAHADAQRRMRKGQRQVYCKTCKRWKWPDELCPLADTQPKVLP